MRNLLVSGILFLAVISGTSKPLLLLASASVVILTLFRLDYSYYSFKINHIGSAKASLFMIITALTLISLPLENISKYAMTLTSSILAVLIVSNIRCLNIKSQIRIYSLVLGLILLGDLIHMSGLLGVDMNTYKSLVQFNDLSNLERESNMGFLGLRYYGWFAEPSYHGAFTGLLIALIWNRGVWKRALFFTSILFVLCPTPMMVLALCFGIVLGKRNWLYVFIKRPLTTVIAVVLVGLAISGLFATRFSALTNSISEESIGERVNSSEAIRLVYPVIALSSHLASHGLLPESIERIRQNPYLPESLKFPLITYMVFFGFIGLVSIVMFIAWLYQATIFRVIVVITISSILSGGGGYVLQFSLIVAMLLHLTAQNASSSIYAGINPDIINKLIRYAYNPKKIAVYHNR